MHASLSFAGNFKIQPKEVRLAPIILRGRMRSIADELAFIGSPVSDEDLTMHILGPEFNPFVVAATTSYRQEPLSLPDLLALLLSHEALLNSQNSSSPSLPSTLNPTAFYSSSTRPNNPRPFNPRYPPTRPPFTSPAGPRPNRPYGPRPTLPHPAPLLPNPPQQFVWHP